MSRGNKVLHRLVYALFFAGALPNMAFAQSADLNYDTLSSLEEPIAFDIGEITVALTGLVDVPIAVEIESAGPTDDVELGFVGNFQVTAQAQLLNRWTIGAAYFGQYATDAATNFNNKDAYADNIAGFVATSFGTVIGGNVSGQVRESTRRKRGAGNGFLAFDNFLGGLDDWGGAYVGRFGPMTLSGAVDENGDFEIGGSFQRPIGRKDYRLSLRIASGRMVSNDLSVFFDTKGVLGVAELTYGSSRFDIGAGFERLQSRVVDVDRWFVSAGAQTKLASLSLSAEGHYGRSAGDKEISAALGAAYDIARGLSLNLGINYEEANINAGSVNLVSSDEVQGLFSLRYSF